MKSLILLIVFVFTFTANAQDETYEYLTRKQRKTALKIAQQKTGATIIYDSGMKYNDMFFWNVITYHGKKLYFNSSSSFTNVNYKEDKYPCLLEYVIEVVGF